jgi:hypothetical protein
MANMILPINSSSVMPTLPMATPMQSTFFNWNLMVDLTSVILLARSSLWETGVGNFPALERPGPRRRGICLIKASEEMKASYLRASFLMSFLFLLSFFKSCEKSVRRCAIVSRIETYVSAHGIDTVVLGTIDVVLVTEDAKSHACGLLSAFAFSLTAL